MKGAVSKLSECRDTCEECIGVIDAIDVIDRRRDATASLLVGERKQLDQPRAW